jgi:hypothetical protein
MLLPIPSGRKLSVFEIAKLWSCETKPPAPHQELLIAIGQAWWRGELVAVNAPSRLKVLRALYSTCRDSIAFIIPSMTEPPQGKLLDDGRWEVFLRMPLPNADPDTWTEANCAEAFEVIAKEWDEVACDEEWFQLTAPIVAGIVLTQDEFNQWIGKMRYPRPNFWGNGSEEERGLQRSNKRVHQKRTKPAQWHIQRAVDALTKEHGGEFPPPSMPVFERDRLIREWLAGDDDPVKPPSKRILRDYFNKPRT